MLIYSKFVSLPPDLQEFINKFPLLKEKLQCFFKDSRVVVYSLNSGGGAFNAYSEIHVYDYLNKTVADIAIILTHELIHYSQYITYWSNHYRFWSNGTVSDHLTTMSIEVESHAAHRQFYVTEIKDKYETKWFNPELLAIPVVTYLHLHPESYKLS